jgi:putative DNA primase/helicase
MMGDLRLDVRVVRDAARGRWGDILSALSPDLADALLRVPRHGPCPKHGGVDGFRIFRDYETTGGGVCNTCGTFSDGFALLGWVNDWTFPQTLAAVAEHLHVEPTYALDIPEVGGYNSEPNRVRLLTFWRQCQPDDGHISTYLRSRGLSGVVPVSLRYHPNLDYYSQDGELLASYPAMCAPVQNRVGDMVSIHRTYLNEDCTGKADVSNPKKLVKPVYPGATAGAAIRLGPIMPSINVTEGIETGLAVQEHTGVSTFAAVSAGGLQVFIPPPGVHYVTVWADKDVSGTGQTSSSILKRRLSERGYGVQVKMPMRVGDWLDVLHP